MSSSRQHDGPHGGRGRHGGRRTGHGLLVGERAATVAEREPAECDRELDVTELDVTELDVTEPEPVGTGDAVRARDGHRRVRADDTGDGADEVL